MKKASEQTLSQRNIVKASRKPKSIKEVGVADAEILKQRRIIKAKRSSFGTPPRTSSDDPSQATRNQAHASPSTSVAHTEPLRKPAEHTHPPNNNREILLEVRAKLFTRDGNAWVNRGSGKLSCYQMSDKRGITLQKGDDTMFHVEKLRKLTKLIKESSKGQATYVKFLAVLNVKKGEEVCLLQVQPDVLASVYSTMTLLFG